MTDPGRVNVKIDDRHFTAAVTNEGIIVDFFIDNNNVGTWAVDFDEMWSNRLPPGDFVPSDEYPTLEDWARDSDYIERDDGEWVQIDYPSIPVDLISCWYGAMEALAFEYDQ